MEVKNITNDSNASSKNENISILPDHHIHSGFSRCSPFEHRLIDIVKTLESIGQQYYCISDHIHFDEDHNYIAEHIKDANRIQTEGIFKRPLFLGAEMTILSSKGIIPKLGESFPAEKLGYIIIADHYIPGTNITMNDLNLSTAILHELLSADSNSKRDKLNSILNILKESYINAILRNNPIIFGHPFSTLIRCNFFHTELLEIFEDICEICKTNNVAIEFNESDFRRCLNLSVNQKIEEIKENNLKKKEFEMILKPESFLKELVKISNESGVMISLGSDAHKLDLIHNLKHVYQIIEDNSISSEKILNFLEFCPNKKQILNKY